MAEVGKLLSLKKIALLEEQKNRKKVADAIGALSAKNEELNGSLKLALAREETAAREAAVKAASAEPEASLAELESQMNRLRAEESALLAHYSFDNVRKSVIDKSPIGSSAQALVRDLQESAHKITSQRFISAYFGHVGRWRVSGDDFLGALDQLEGAGELFYRYQDSKLFNAVTVLANWVRGLDLDDGLKIRPGVTIVVGIVALALCIFIFPMYIVLLGGVFIMNIAKTFSIKVVIDLINIVETNSSMMEQALGRRAQQEYDTRHSSISEQFSKASGILRQRIDTVKEEISVARQEALSTFRFDSSAVKKSFDGSFKGVEFDMADQSRQLEQIDARVESIRKEIATLEKEDATSRARLVASYLNFDKVGESRLFPERFLLDDGDPLKFFSNAASSVVFAYRDAAAVSDFIRLVCVQLRTLMAPMSVQVQIWDTATSGTQFVSFLNPDPGGDNGGFTICNNSDSVKEALAALVAILQKRLQTIRISYNDITQYNMDMLSLKSVTEDYYIVFILCPSLLLDNEGLKRLMTSGPELGIYPYVFAEATRMTPDYHPLLESCGYAAVVQNGNVITQAVAAIMEQIRNRPRG
jgi:hypothetical protein